jgi:formate hydrogenlyase transcriptional activator
MAAATVLAASEDELIGSSPGLRKVLHSAQLVAQTDSSVLIQGETGTGKELIARAIHKMSARRQGPCVKLNCAAMPAGLVESELFGHERGAFTGAFTETTGRFQRANNGTLFLDEVGDLPMELQPALESSPRTGI